MNNKLWHRLLLICLVISLVTVPVPPPVQAVESPDTVDTLNRVATPHSIYEMVANSPYSGASEGEQISPVSGTLRWMETDFVLPGRNGLDVAITRLYESNTAHLEEPFAISGSSGIGTDMEQDTYKERTYNLGAGWSFAFPSLEMRDGAMFVHLPDGSVYETASGGAGLVGYPLQDLSFGPSSTVLQTTDASEAAVSATAAFELSDTVGTTVYFDADGKWIGSQDAYGNVIVVEYANNPVNEGMQYPLMNRIIDTLNREITFAYTSNSMTVGYGDGQQIVYRKRLISNTNKERELASVTNENGETTAYEYTKLNVNVDYDTRVSGSDSVLYVGLTRVAYPTGSRTTFEYTTADKRLGEHGVIGYPRVTSRYDEIREGIFRKKNRVNFTYDDVDFTDPSVTGYTTVETMISNPNAPGHISPENKLVVTNTLNGKHQVTNATWEKEGEYRREIQMAYDPLTELTTSLSEVSTDYTVDPAATDTLTEQYSYDAYGNMISFTNARGHISDYTYANHYPGLMTTERTMIGGVTALDMAYTVDAELPQVNQVVQSYLDEQGQPATEQESYLYDAYGNVTQMTRQLEGTRTQRTTIDYDGTTKHAYPTSIKQYLDEDGNERTIEQRYTYDLATGRVLTYHDGNAVKQGTPELSSQSYMYDAVGRLTQVTHPKVDGEIEAGVSTYDFSYDTINQQSVLEMTDEEGRQTRWIHDGLGRPHKLQMQKQKDNSNNIIFYDVETRHYNEVGELDYSLDGEGKRTEYTYDAAGRLVAVTSAEGRVVGTSYNDVLRQTTHTSDYGQVTTNTTDELGRTTGTQRANTLTGSLATTMSTAYEVNGDPFQTEQTDALGSVTGMRNDGLHRLQTITQTPDALAAPQLTSYQYNKLGNLTTKVFADASQLSYTYDEWGRRLSKTDSLTGSEWYTYDDNSNLTGGTTRRGMAVNNQFDARNRLTGWTSGSESASFTYEKNGQRKTMTDETGTTTYTYYPNNQVERITYPDGKWISYTYYDNGLRHTMTDPFDEVYTYTYNQDNQLTGVSASGTQEAAYSYRDSLPIEDLNYLKTSQLHQLKLAQTLVTTYRHDGFGRLTELSHSGGGLGQTFGYTYDDNDNILTRTDGTTSGSFTYDQLNRIISSTEGNELYTYDQRGNRLTLQSSQQVPHTDTVQYTYDDADQLTGVNRGEAVVTYAYNGDGLMTERTETVDGVATTTRYYYDGMNIIAEGTVSGDTVTFKARYARGEQLLYRENTNGSKAYYLHNGHGDVTGLYAADGTQLNHYTYDNLGQPPYRRRAS
ncbi:RHS repeat protein [Paenibacillus daejeonensis]|uniref:RHS repeat protein n=1 Tax=Paenibacillus daejeonensis TaxID=135193 RepID=UPI00037E519D|nr:RHS repeat protein [Paenibacillus daejeonensis]